MAFEQRDMSGVLFKNDRKEKPAQPDYRGEIAINGQTFRIAGWVKEGAKGKFLSLAAQAKQDQPVANGASRSADDEIPFAPGVAVIS
jgi:hypothetical protein